MADYTKLLEKHKEDVLNALYYLKFSFKKIEELSMNLKDADPELLETWESFVARFARVTDIFLMKYIRVKILMDDPNFEGTFIDQMNRAEKMGIISNAHQWIDIRKLRNQATHDYTAKELEPFLKKIKELTPMVLSIEEKLL